MMTSGAGNRHSLERPKEYLLPRLTTPTLRVTMPKINVLVPSKTTSTKRLTAARCEWSPADATAQDHREARPQARGYLQAREAR